MSKRREVRKPSSRRGQPSAPAKSHPPRRMERIFNLYLIIQSSIIRALAAKSHDSNGSEDELIIFLQNHVEEDFATAQYFPIPVRYQFYDLNTSKSSPGLKYDTFMDLAGEGLQLHVFEEVFKTLGASSRPLVCITPIVEGKPKIQVVIKFDAEGHLMPWTAVEQAQHAESVRNGMVRLAEIPDDPGEDDREFFRAMDAARPNSPLFQRYY